MSHKIDLNKILDDEEIILERALKDAEDDNLSLHELVSKFKDIVDKYKKLTKMYKKVCRISDFSGKELNRSENALKMLVDNSNQGFLTFDSTFIIGKSFSKQCNKLLGCNISHKNIIDLLSSGDSKLYSLFEEVFTNTFQANNLESKMAYLKELPSQFFIKKLNIKIEYRFINNTESYNDKDLIMLILTDVTEKVMDQEKINFLNYHDSLTGLYNRAYLDSIFPLIKNEENFPVGIIFGDMNGLKLTNDVFGHQKGDELIINLANILKRAVWNDDVIVRMGGDEFVIVLTKTSYLVCEQVCKRIKILCSQSKWDPIPPTIALGIAMQERKLLNFDELFIIAEKNMYKNKTIESSEVKKTLLFCLEKIIIRNHYESLDHIERLKVMMIKMADKLGYIRSELDVEKIELFTKLHDIGKVAIENEILNQKMSLSEKEWEIIKTHSEIGFRMAQAIEEQEIAKNILYIHERWDGTGYPQGLKETKIPILSRVFSIVEAYEVMTIGRHYKLPISKELALEEIKRCSGTQFDPDLVELFLTVIE